MNPPPNCTCGHSWEHHHHGCIMDPAYPSNAPEYGVWGGVAAQECEEHQVNGEYDRPYSQACKCSHYINSESKKDVGDLYDKIYGKEKK